MRKQNERTCTIIIIIIQLKQASPQLRQNNCAYLCFAGPRSPAQRNEGTVFFLSYHFAIEGCSANWLPPCIERSTKKIMVENNNHPLNNGRRKHSHTPTTPLCVICILVMKSKHLEAKPAWQKNSILYIYSE